MKLDFNETTRYIKRMIKRKTSYTKALVITFLMTGMFSTISYTGTIKLEGSKIGDESNMPTGNNMVYLGNSTVANDTIKAANGSVVLGFGHNASESGFVIIGENSSAMGGQSVAVGSGVHARNKQATAIGNNVVAGGIGSIAIGSDDVGKEQDTDFKKKFVRGIPKSIYDKYIADKDTMFKDLVDANHSLFRDKNSIYSPTWSKGTGAIAIGGRSVAYGDGSLALGTLSIAEGNLSAAIGSNSGAFADYSQAIGSDTFIYAKNSLGVGSHIQVLNEGGMAYGYNANSGGEGSIAIGSDVSANTEIDYTTSYRKSLTNSGNFHAEYKLHITEEENEKIKNGTINNSNQLSSLLAFDLNGTSKVAGGNERLNSGNYFASNPDGKYIDMLEEAIAGSDISKEITELEAGTNIDKIKSNGGKNAIVIGSKSAAIGNNSLAFGRGTFSKEKNSISIGSYSYNIGENTIAIGLATKGLSKNSVVLGVGSGVDLNSDNSTVIGTGSAVFAKNSAILGARSSVWGDSNFVIGNSSIASGKNNLLFGSNAESQGDEKGRVVDSIGIGKDVKLTQDPSVAFGESDESTNTSSVIAIGNRSKAYFSNSVALGVESETDYVKADLEMPAYMPDGSFSIPSSQKTGIISVGRKGAERRITNVAGGFLNTDAVNVSQLKALEDKINGVNLDSAAAENTSRVPYYAINLKDVQIQDPQAKKAAWKKYVELQKNLKIIENRKNNNGDVFDAEVTNNLNSEISKIEAKYTNFKEKLSDKFITLNIETGSNDEDKRLKFKANNDKINEIVKETLEIEVVTEEEKESAKESNYTSQLAYGENSMALGYKAQAGKENEKNGENALAIGTEAKAYENGTIALGYQSVSDRKVEKIEISTEKYIKKAYETTSLLGALSVGSSVKGKEKYRQIINVAPGTEDTDAVNLAQLKEAVSNIKSFDNGLDLGDKQITNVASGIKNSTSSTSGSTNDNNIEKILDGTFSSQNPDISKNAVNVKDLSDVAKAIVEKGITLKGNKLTEAQPPKEEQETLKIGGTVTLESSQSVNGESKGTDATTQAAKDNDIKISVKSGDTNNTNGSKDNVKLKLTLNKSEKVAGNDERVVTSKAVNTAIDAMKKDILGLEENDTKTGFKDLSFTKLKDIKGADSTDKVKTFKGAIDKVNSKLNEGLTFGADIIEKNSEKNKTQYLGSKFEIKTAKSVIQESKNNSQTRDYAGNNLQTRYTNTEGNGLLEIGLAKELQEMTSFETASSNGAKSKLDKDGLTVGDTSDNNNADKSNAHYGKNGISIKNGKTENIFLGMKDEKGAKTSKLEFADKKGRITGLSDITDADSEDTAVNKKYVDEKLKKADANSPINSATYTNEKGDEIVKYGDKYYKKNEIPEDVTYDESQKKFVKKDGSVLNAQPQAISDEDAKKVNGEIKLKDKVKITNVESGLGVAENETNNKDLINNLLGNNTDTSKNIQNNNEILNNVATIRDLQALGKAGIDFAGNDAATLVHRNLGQKLVVKGDVTETTTAPQAGTSNTAKTFESAKDNINVVADKDKGTLTVQLSKELKNLTSAEFTKEVDGKKLVSKVDGEGSRITDGTNTLETKANGISLKHKASDPSAAEEKEVFSITNEAGKVTVDFKNKDGKIKGLADISDEEKDGSLAVNKNYVDSKIKALSDSSPLKYENEKGEKLVKGKDGKLYNPEDIKDKKYVEGKGYISDNDQTPVSDVKDIKTVLEPNAKLAGINSGIGLDIEAAITDKMTEEEIKKAKQDAEKQIKETINNFIDGDIDSNVSKNAVNVRDLHSVSKALINKGLLFGADKGDTVTKALGETIKVNGGKNINTEVKDGNIFVNLNDKIELSGTILDDTGLNVTKMVEKEEEKLITDDEAAKLKPEEIVEKEGKKYQKIKTKVIDDNAGKAHYGNEKLFIGKGSDKIELTPTSVIFKNNNGKISGLADPTNEYDAVNKRYVDTIKSNMDEQVSGLKGGVAGAMAMANLVQANSFSDYRHQLSAAFGAYDGKQALAVGYSGITKNRRLVYKLSGSVDSLGKLGFGAGIGIMLGEKNEQTPNNYPQNLVKELEDIKKENKQYKKDISKLEDKNKAMEKELQEIKKLLKMK